MKQTLRISLLLLLAGILFAAAPSLAGNRAADHQAATTAQSAPLVTALTFMQSLISAVRAQITLWLNTASTPSVKSVIVKPAAGNDAPVKSSADARTRRPWLYETVLLDNGGENVS